MRGAKTHLPGWLQVIVNKRNEFTGAEGSAPGSDGKAAEAATMYRQIFGISRAVRIEFVGVWVIAASRCVSTALLCVIALL